MDQTGNGNNASIGAGSPTQVTSFSTGLGKAVFFNLAANQAHSGDTGGLTDTVNEFLKLADGSGVNFGSSDSFTMTFLQSVPRNQVFSGDNTGPALVANKSWDVNSTQDTQGFVLSDYFGQSRGSDLGVNLGTTSSYVDTANIGLPLSQTYLTVMRVDRATNRMTVYNIPLSATSIASALSQGTGGVRAVNLTGVGNLTGGPISIGNDGMHGDPGTNTPPLNTVGEIDEFAIWNQALSDTDLNALLNTLAAGNPTNSLVSSIKIPSGALVTPKPDGTIDYNPNGAFDYLQNGQTATDSFTYTLQDGQGQDTATVTVTITGSNNGPIVTVLGPATQSAAVGTTVTNFGIVRDPDGPSLSATVDGTADTDPLLHGTLTATAIQGTVTSGLASLPSNRQVQYNPTENRFDFLNDSANNDVMYRLPVPPAGAFAAGDTLKATYTINYDPLTPSNLLGFALSDGTQLIGAAASNAGVVSAVDGKEAGTSFADDATPNATLAFSGPFTVTLTVTMTTATVMVTNGKGDSATFSTTAGTGQLNNFSKFDLTKEIDFVLLSPDHTQNYGVRSLSFDLQAPNGLNGTGPQGFRYWSYSHVLASGDSNPLTVNVVGNDSLTTGSALVHHQHGHTPRRCERFRLNRRGDSGDDQRHRQRHHHPARRISHRHHHQRHQCLPSAQLYRPDRVPPIRRQPDRRHGRRPQRPGDLRHAVARLRNEHARVRPVAVL